MAKQQPLLDVAKSQANATEREAAVQVSRHAEALFAEDGLEAFPEEGTDDKTVQGPDTGEIPFSDAEATIATLAVIELGLAGQGETGNFPPGGLHDGSDPNQSQTSTENDRASSRPKPAASRSTHHHP